MKRLVLVLTLVLASVSALVAHGNNEHVRGVVTEISAKAITVRVADNSTKTLTLNDKTTFELSGKPAHMSDVKVGDRVVIDVPKNTMMAAEIRVGVAPKK